MRATRSLHIPNFDAVLERHRTAHEIRPALPDAKTYAEALLTPASRSNGEFLYRGALFDRDGRRIEAGDLIRDHLRINTGSPELAEKRIPGTAIYLGWLFREYGHALFESLARCFALEGSDFAVFHGPKASEVPDFVRAHLDRLGVGRVVVPTVPTRFERLIVPQPAFQIKTRAYEGFLDTFRSVATAPDPRPVYVSRSRLPPHRRAIVGEAVLEEHLTGWRVVHPQSLSMDEQIEIFSAHTTFAGPIGSAMHNILFSRSPEVTYLTDGAPNINYLQCDDLVGADSIYVGCCDLGGMPDLGRRMPLRLDLARAADALGVSLDPALQPAVDRRHRELWAEVALKQAKNRRDASALEEVRGRLEGQMTPWLLELEKRLEASLDEPKAPAVGKRERRWPRSLGSRGARPER